MTKQTSLTFLDKLLIKTEFKLILSLSYIISIGYIATQKGLIMAVITHVIISLVFAVFRFGSEFIKIFFFPIWMIGVPIEQLLSLRYINRFKQNTPEETVIILGHSNWHKLSSWIKPNYSTSELKILVKLLNKQKKNFSFYTKATLRDVEDIMKNTKIKEVYFLGHDDSHVFCLGTNEYLYYCEFRGGQYKKDYIHQVHCGTKHGKSLIDYVVPEENREECFFFRKEINGAKIIREFKKQINQKQLH